LTKKLTCKKTDLISFVVRLTKKKFGKPVLGEN